MHAHTGTIGLQAGEHVRKASFAAPDRPIGIRKYILLKKSSFKKQRYPKLSFFHQQVIFKQSFKISL